MHFQCHRMESQHFEILCTPLPSPTKQEVNTSLSSVATGCEFGKSSSSQCQHGANTKYNRPAPACQGHRAACLGTIRLSTIIGHAFSFQPSATTCRTQDLLHVSKTINFQRLFPGQRKPENLSRKLLKNKENTHEIHKIHFGGKFCLQYFPSENLELKGPERRHFNPEIN